MKKVVLFLLIFGIIVTFCGCQAVQAEDGSDEASDGIPFEYFYRGFTHVDDLDDEQIEIFHSGAVICTEEDWFDFCGHYSSIVAKFSWPDFSEYCLVVFGAIYGSTAAGLCSFGIDKLVLDKSGRLGYAYAEEGAAEIWAEHTSGPGHLFMNIITVKAEDLPEGCISVYTAFHK